MHLLDDLQDLFARLLGVLNPARPASVLNDATWWGAASSVLHENAIGSAGFDRGMPVSVDLQTFQRRKLAAVRREVAPGTVGPAWGPALGKV